MQFSQNCWFLMKLLHCQSKHGFSSDKTPSIDCGEDNRKYQCDAYLCVTNSGKPHATCVSSLLPAAIMLSLAFSILPRINYVSTRVRPLWLCLLQLSGLQQTKLSVKLSHYLFYKTFYHIVLQNNNNNHEDDIVIMIVLVQTCQSIITMQKN